MEDDSIKFTEESLKAQDGLKFPLRLVPGGPIVAEGTMTYDSETGELTAQYQTDDPNVAELLKDTLPIIFKKEIDG